MTLHIDNIESYHVGSLQQMSIPQCQTLLPLLKSSAGSNAEVLGGRREVQTMEIPGIGPVAVKSYARGGLLSVFVKKTYVRTSKIRSLSEFEWLIAVNNLGISAPEPIACIWQGNLFYKCWLVMADIGPHDTLAQISLTDENRANNLLPVIQEKISVLIHNNILHVDLHPGNILVDKKNRIYIIDFDKAKRVGWSKTRFKKKYAQRWERAIFKHRLPVSLNTLFF